MGLYAPETFTCAGANFLCPGYPVAKEALAIATGQTIKQGNLVTVDSDGKLKAYTSSDLSSTKAPYAVAAEDGHDGVCVVYMTGAFFEDGIVLPDGVTIAAVKPLCRENGIFLQPLTDRA